MKLISTIIRFAKIFHENHFQIFLVGGAVRDYLRGSENFDYDFATNATPQDVMRIFRSVIPVGIDHGTVIVLFEKNQFEVTTFRSEDKYSDNRHPDKVNFVKSIEEDLKRRDFTINAFAYDIINKKLIDNYNGKEDLEKKLIRAIGNPNERFKEDALRMLRACRFASQLNFTIEDNTLSAIQDLSKNINNISAERIRDELIKMMISQKPSIGLEYIRISGLMQYILPELLNCYEVVQNRFHKYDVYYHSIYTCDAAPSDNYIIRFAALFHDIAKPQTKREKDEAEDENSFYNHEVIGARIAYRILKRFKFKNEDTKKISHLIKHHMFYYTKEWTDGAVRRFIRNVDLENLDDLFTLREADRAGNGMKQGIPIVYHKFKERINKILEIDSAFKIKDLDINGNTIMEKLKLKPGPIIGEILNYLLELVLDDPEINKNETLLNKAIEYYKKKENYSFEIYGETPENLGEF
ncbi:MAG: HD domain-containing protein [Spirochaetes bacterium]|nr:HD domain-containing protein [Spirochaetota bacterium]